MSKLKFGSKLSLTTLLLAFLAAGLTVFFSYRMGANFLISQMQSRVLDLGRTGAMLIGSSERQAILEITKEIKRDNQNLTRLFANNNVPAGSSANTLTEKRMVALLKKPEVQNLIQVLRKIKTASQVLAHPSQELGIDYALGDRDPDLKYVYLLVDPDLSPDQRYVLVVADSEFTDQPGDEINIGSLYNLQDFPKLRRAFKGKSSVEKEFIADAYGTYLTAGIPITDRAGKTLAVLALDLDIKSSSEGLQTMLKVSLIVLGITMFVALVITLGVSSYFVRPIKKLNKGALEVKNRNFETEIKVRTHDELQVLAETFNGMVSEINRFAVDMEELNQAYYRFVPQEFIQNLKKDSVLQVESGDNVQRKISVLFSDIRSFTSLSESMTPDENFNFINGYLDVMAPRIIEHEGFIDKYIGDAIMALFPSSAAEAVKGGVSMLEGLQQYNEDRKSPGVKPVAIGIGIHTGMSMMGTVGSEARMEATVISDSVNFASRLEGLTKTFGAQMLISQATFDDAGDVAMTRYIGEIFAKGKSKSQHIYEVIPDTIPLAAHKQKTKDRFEQGVRFYQQAKIAQARKCFAQVLKSSTEDRAAKMYYLLCKRYKQGDSVNLVMHAK